MIMQEMKCVLVAAVFVAAYEGTAHAAALIDWNFAGFTSTSQGVPPAPRSIAPGVSSTGLRKGDAGNPFRYSGAGDTDSWGVRGIQNSYAQAVQNDVAIYFDLIIAPGTIYSLDSIQTPWFTKMPSGQEKDDPDVYAQWQYSVGGGTWNDIGGPEKPSHTSYDWVNLDLTGYEDLTEITDITVTFRLLLWGGAVNGNSMIYFGKDTLGANPASPYYPDMLSFPNTLSIHGTVVVLPEPTAMALIVLSGAALLLRRRKRE